MRLLQSGYGAAVETAGRDRQTLEGSFGSAQTAQFSDNREQS